MSDTLTPASILAYLRTHITPDSREKLYLLAGIAVAVIGAKAQIDTDTQTAILAVIASSIALLFAVLFSASTRVAALYTLLAAAAGLGQIFATVTDTGWVGWVGVGIAILGQGVAAFRTPTSD